MLARILVAYATRYGSTQEVAEAVADTLRLKGYEVAYQPMQQTATLEGYDAVVLGAPIYIGKWHQDAHRFLLRHQAALMQRPVAVFALGPISPDESEMQGSREQFAQELGRYPWLTPVSQEMFVGKYDPAKLNFLHNLLTRLPASPLHDLPASDHRDWDAIRAWARNLAANFDLLRQDREQPT